MANKSLHGNLNTNSMKSIYTDYSDGIIRWKKADPGEYTIPIPEELISLLKHASIIEDATQSLLLYYDEWNFVKKNGEIFNRKFPQEALEILRHYFQKETDKNKMQCPICDKKVKRK